jgi:acetyl-CoA C-acetyltransferase
MYIKGVGMTKFGISDKLSPTLAYEAGKEAVRDADIDFSKIDAIVCSSVEWFFSEEKQRHFSAMLSSIFKTRKPIIRVPAACGGGGVALWTAKQLDYDNVLVIGAEKLMTGKSEQITEEFMMAAESKWEQLEGLNFPGQNALVAQEYLRKYPNTNMDHLAMISFKNHSNAFLNPKAKFYGHKVTLEQIKNSPIVCSPLRLYDCSISVDGAAACVISKDKTDVEIVGSDSCTDYLPTWDRESITSWEASVKTSSNAYKQAGIGASDVDMAELHDAFSIVELIAYEDLGFAKKGEAYKKIEDGYFNLDSKLPVNMSGGLKAKGHPISATGVSQIYELVKQLRGECGDRQVSDAKIGLAQNIGGAGGTISTHILRKING